MDGERMDRITRALANGMSRRGAMKALAGGLGLSGAVAPRAMRAAKPTWWFCRYYTLASNCQTFGFDLCVRDGCRDIDVQGVVYRACGEPIPDLSKKECNDLLQP
jgi:hypothetical protein